MNLFVTSNCPQSCASFLDDKRLRKMVLETAQLLCTAVYHQVYAIKYPKLNNDSKRAFKQETGLYLPTHSNHPVNVWCRQNRSNYLWTLDHFSALLDEYKFRFDKTHACQELLPTLEYYAEFFHPSPMTEFVNCAKNSSKGLDFSHVYPVYDAYKLYLQERFKSDILKPKWTKGENRNVTN